MKAKLILNQVDVRNRLHEVFGVTREQLLPVIQAGVMGRNECTRHHPASMPGIRCWGESTKTLRDLFVPLGWKADNTDNIPSVVNRKRQIKIIVTNANGGTGLELEHPQPITEKGDGTKRAFFPNENPLFNVADEGLNDIQGCNHSIWYLCIFCGADMIRAELCCPILDENGLFKDFNERIALISDRDENGGFSVRRDVPESPDGDSGFEINVIRKQA